MILLRTKVSILFAQLNSMFILLRTKESILFAQLNSMCLAEEWWLKKNIISILIIKIQTSY